MTLRPSTDSLTFILMSWPGRARAGDITAKLHHVRRSICWGGGWQIQSILLRRVHDDDGARERTLVAGIHTKPSSFDLITAKHKRVIQRQDCLMFSECLPR